MKQCLVVLVATFLCGSAWAAPANDVCRVESARVEAVASEPGTGRVLAIQSGRLAVWNSGLRLYAPGSGYSLSAVVGMAFDPTTGNLYGTTGRSLVQIDPVAGVIVAGAFGKGLDALPIQGLSEDEEVRDLAIDPLDGQVFGSVALSTGGEPGRLIRLGLASGESVEIGSMIASVDGLSMDSFGQLWATSNTQRYLYKVNKETAWLGAVRPLQGKERAGALSCLCNGLDDCSMDGDGDGLTNARETAIGTNPFSRDTDGDDLDDREESMGGRFIDKNNNDINDAVEPAERSQLHRFVKRVVAMI
jgi:hypothetical protein